MVSKILSVSGMALPLTHENSDDLPTTGEGAMDIPDRLPLLPLRDIVIFPFLIVPLFVQREKSQRAIESVLPHRRLIVLATQRDPEEENPTEADLHRVGTVAMVMRLLKLGDGRVRVLVQGLTRAALLGVTDEGGYLQAQIQPIAEAPVELSLEVEALLRAVKSLLERIVTLGKPISAEVLAIAASLDDPGRLADLCASNLDAKISDAQAILEETDPVARLRRVHDLMAREVGILTVQQEIISQAKGEIDRSQREFYLRQQLKAIQQELGEVSDLGDDIAAYQEKIAEADLPERAREEAIRQLKRLERLHPDAAEAGLLRTYLDTLLALPWRTSSEDHIDLQHVKAVLDADHYGLEPVKERILEALAVRRLKPDAKGILLCLVGPPGVGKTSLGRSVAKAIGRKFVHISLGGVHDEAEIRGHRRTYVGAMPGRIILGLQQAGTNNPLMLLDEVDKLGHDFRGDPAAALLEVLDPEQNHAFRDNYLGVPFDLSKVMFMLTANVTDTIQPALRDRLEIVRLPGYTPEEKLVIARRHLAPKQMAENGLTSRHIKITESALRSIIARYTREAGVRQLEREIGKVCRKVARRVAEGATQKTVITAATLVEYLGVPKFKADAILAQDRIGVAAGLAWTSVGGDVMHVEALLLRGKGSLLLTGKLGEVMKESAHAALSYAKSRARELGIDPDVFAQHDLHIHVPEGAIPKDGPSAGVTMVTAMVSALARRPVKRSVAMTGEITLRGDVLPVGGVREKVLAARRAGVKVVILPAKNQPDVADIPAELIKGLKFVYVNEVGEVFAAALGKAVKNQPAKGSAK
ncbi:MAG: endopeptidase La [Chloracidobacterium sp.]|nr:endopeptidase La [Chloracidobacterium sp.]MDW8217495.1 endopeptidase La [Acidobacteriota bacterium]